MRIAVAGGTGLVGRYVVTELIDAGHDPVVLSRTQGVDLVSGTGLDQVLKDAQVLIDVSNVATLSRKRSEEFFAAGTRNLQEAGARAGVRHHLVLSIVGVDRVDSGYYAGKRRQEELAMSGPIPASVLRSTQFREFAQQVLARSRGPVAVVPRMRIQPIAAREVANALVTLSLGPAVGHAPELAGPEEQELVEMARRLAKARGLRRRLLPIRVPGHAGRAMAEGALLPTEPGTRGRLTFDEWLEHAVPRR
jgi:uncharacterized protein YbjT (DUF2867 family)